MRFKLVSGGIVGRLARVTVVAAAALGALAPAASATSATTLAHALQEYWTFSLLTPSAQNPFTTDNNRCLAIGSDVVAPVLPFAPVTTTCTVNPGQQVFIGEMSVECSTAEAPPFHGGNPAQLRECAENDLEGPVGILNVHTLTVDGTATPVTEVETPVHTVVLPPDNMLGVPAQTALTIARGWVAQLHPMTPGVHTLAFTFAGTFLGGPIGESDTITIVVRPTR